MPNWVFNTVTISGDKHALNSFMERAKQPYDVHGETRSEELSFWNFVKPEDVELYKDNWYNWNIDNWGCKWDASDVYVQDHIDDDTVRYLEFNSPWGPPIEAFRAMAGLYPELTFEFHYAEEQGWGGVLEGRQGGLFVMKEWDIPESHEARMDAMSWCYCEEMREDELKDAYDDCPRKMELANS